MTLEEQIESLCTEHAAPFVLRKKLKAAAQNTIAEERERCAKIVDSFDTFEWSDSQRNVVRIAAHKIREG